MAQNISLHYISITFAPLHFKCNYICHDLSGFTAWWAPSHHHLNWYWTLHWRHNDHDGVSNHQPHGCLLKGSFRRRIKKTSKLRVTGLCAVNSPGPVNSSHKGPVTRKMFPSDDVIMQKCNNSHLRQSIWKYVYKNRSFCFDFSMLKNEIALTFLSVWAWCIAALTLFASLRDHPHSAITTIKSWYLEPKIEYANLYHSDSVHARVSDRRRIQDDFKMIYTSDAN